MFEDSWSLYETRRPRKWIFHQPRRSMIGPLLTILAACMVVYEAVSRF